MKKKKKDVNYLDLIPEMNFQWEKNPEGRVVLLIPRFKNPLLKKLGSKMGKSEFLRVTLDEIGTGVWQLIDGNRTVGEIGKVLEAQQQEKGNSEPFPQLYERLTKYFTSLYHHRFIGFKNW